MRSRRPALRAARRRTTRQPGLVRLAVGLAAAAAVLVGPASTGALGSGATQAARLDADPIPVDPPLPFDLPTHVRVSSFNLLGYGHTVAGGDHPRYTDGITRMGYAVRIIRSRHLQVVGFQEMQKPQYERFRQLAPGFDIYPGAALTTAAMANSIAWSRSQWQLVEARTIPIPYFHGNLIRMPYVLLQNKQTGREAWFFNSHNPADAHGDAQRWRDQAVRIESALFNQLQVDYPTTPIISTGDENDKARYVCPMVRTSQMRASNGGGLLGTSCVAPDQMHVDWIMGSPLVSFTSHLALRNWLVKKTTDHFVVMADAVLPSAAVTDTSTSHAVVLAFDGLTVRGLTTAVANGTAPHLAQMLTDGASTLNARAEVESTELLPTLAGMLTGRPVDPAQGGTGVDWRRTPRGTLAMSAGHYVAGLFDTVHDYGRSTALYTSRSEVDRLATSWNAANGAPDSFGLDNGRAKIGQYVRTVNDPQAVSALTGRLATASTTVSVVQLGSLDRIGEAYGFRSERYAAAVSQADALVGRVQAAISANPSLDGHTLLVVTANRGGVRGDADPRTVRAVYRVPLLVTGPGVQTGGNLYAMNPGFIDPGTTNPDYATGNPIRTTMIANLVTKMLGLPPVPGSTMGYAQDLTVLPPPAAPPVP